MEQFAVPCRFGDIVQTFPLLIGEPAADAHPLEQQIAWLERERGGVVPPEVAESFAHLHRIALENGMPFSDLAVWALREQQESTA